MTIASTSPSIQEVDFHGDIKLGISVNAFNCPYLTERTLSILRPYVHYINVVIQMRSNDGGRLMRTDDFEAYMDMKIKGLVDQLLEFEPQTFVSRKSNETNKRTAGLRDAVTAGCNVFMSMDEDEFYYPHEFLNALSMFWESGCQVSVCKMQTYYKSSRFRLVPPEEYYVSLFNRVDSHSFFKEGAWWPYHVDPSRKLGHIDKKNILEFGRDLVQMHHMSYVRRNIMEKLTVQSASKNWPKGNIADIAQWWDNWKYPYQACMGGMKLRYYDIEEVEDYFGV